MKNKLNEINAFTLVELAIVLIIIGLITGGVFGVRSLIEGARTQSIIKEFNEIETAINVFYLEYDALPGDMSDASQYWPGVQDGNNNRLVEWSDGEYHLAWRHLYYSEIYIPSCKTCTGKVVLTTSIGSRSPRSKSSYEHGWSITANTNDNNPTDDTNYLSLATNANNTTLSRGFLPMYAREIDRKMDDGEALQGDFTGYYRWGNCHNGIYPNLSGYNLTTEIKNCGLFKKLNIQ